MQLIAFTYEGTTHIWEIKDILCSNTGYHWYAAKPLTDVEGIYIRLLRPSNAEKFERGEPTDMEIMRFILKDDILERLRQELTPSSIAKLHSYLHGSVN